MKELIDIQRELKVHKSQNNDFGKYKYRSCEDILEVVKPLCVERSCLLTLTDEITMLGDRYYVKATATISLTGNIDTLDKLNTINIEGLNKISVSAYAREAETKKGMDASQITGSASSYARKYALNGLFCIDDTKDADTMDNSTPAPEPATTQQRATLKDYQAGFKKEGDLKAMGHLQVHLDNKDLTKQKASEVIADIKKYLEVPQ